jgi:hypothetical protein
VTDGITKIEWVLVPLKPTEAMLRAAVMTREGPAVYRCVSEDGTKASESEAASVYEAMLAQVPPCDALAGSVEIGHPSQAHATLAAAVSRLEEIERLAIRWRLVSPDCTDLFDRISDLAVGTGGDALDKMIMPGRCRP